MDNIYLIGYFVTFALLRNKWGFFALFACIVSVLFAEQEVSFIITTLVYTPLCLHKQSKVYLSALTMVLFFYIMAWENAVSESYFLSDFVYIMLTTVLNSVLIINLLRAGKDGIYNTNFYRLHDNKLN